MNKLIFKKILNQETDALGLSVFRILYSLVLLVEISRLFKFRHLIYDNIPFQYIGEIDTTFIFIFWFIVLGLLLLGLYTRTATILNYIFGVIIFSSAKMVSYHVYYLYVTVNFLFMFMPVSRVLSFDSLLKKLKYSSINKFYDIDRKILEINYFFPVFACIGLVYFDSIFQKLNSPMWLDGLGMWLPSSLPMMTWNDVSFILNNEWLMKFLGYFVIVFEGAFIFLCWFKIWRVPLMIIGILFHIGILYIYPIPLFAISVMAIYLLLLPEKFWLKLGKLIKGNIKTYKFYYDAECPLCIKTVVFIRHLDIFKKIDCITVQGNAMEDPLLKKYSENELLINIHGVTKKGKVFVGYDAYIELLKKLFFTYPVALLMMLPGVSLIGKKLYRHIAGNRLNQRCTEESCIIPVYTPPPHETDDYLISGWNQLSVSKSFWKCMFFLFIIGQILVIWVSPLVQRRTSMLQSVNRFALSGYYNTKYIFKRYFGVTNHTVFLNDHFDKNNRIFKVTCLYNNKEITLPIIRNNGMSGCYNIGPLWCYYTFFTAFDVTKQQSNYYTFEERVIPFLKYFGKENNINLSDVCFNIYIKEIEIPKKWEKDFLKKQIEKPWKLTGTCKMEKNKFSFHWLNFK